MLAATGGELVLSAPDAEFVKRGADFGFESKGYSPADATRLVRHLGTIRLGDIALTAHLTPGHTPGCTSWSSSVTIAGEPFEFVSVCSLSVLNEYRIVRADPTYPGQGEDYCRSVAHLKSLSPDIFLAPHPGFFGMTEKLERLRAGDPQAFVERNGYRRYLDRAQAAIEQALAEQGHAGGCASLLEASDRH